MAHSPNTPRFRVFFPVFPHFPGGHWFFQVTPRSGGSGDATASRRRLQRSEDQMIAYSWGGLPESTGRWLQPAIFWAAPVSPAAFGRLARTQAQWRSLHVLKRYGAINGTGFRFLPLGWWVGGLVGWWVGGLVGWWVGGLVGWWVGGLVGWWVGGLVGWWVGLEGNRFHYWTQWLPFFQGARKQNGGSRLTRAAGVYVFCLAPRRRGRGFGLGVKERTFHGDQQP